MTRKLFAIFCFALLFTSCIKADDISFIGLRNAGLQKATSSQALGTVDIELRNDSRTRVTLKSAELTLSRIDQPLLEITLTEPVTLPKRSTSIITLPLKLRFKGPLGAFSVLPLLSEQGQQTAYVSGTVRIKAGSTRTLRIDKMPLNQLLKRLDIQDLKQYLDL